MSSDYVRQQIAQAADKRFSSPQAEENVLLQMLKKPDMVAGDVFEALEPEDFSDLDCMCIYRAMQSVRERGQRIEPISVDAAFTAMYPDRAAQLSQKLVGIMGFHDYGSGALENIQDHVGIIRALSKRRKAIKAAEELVDGLRDPAADVGEAVERLQELTDGMQGGGGGLRWVSLNDVNLSTYEYLEARQQGKIRAIPTGIKSLDQIIGGLFGGEMTVVAARPSVGKTAFGLNAAMNAAREGFKVGFVSCEMAKVGLGQRTMSRASWISGDKLRKAEIEPEDWDALVGAMAQMQDMPFRFLFNDPNNPEPITIEAVFKLVDDAAKKGEIDLLVVDYIGIMGTKREFREERLKIAYISRELKRLAMVANIPVIALCQVNRMAQGRMPTMAELRDSGAVEQDADGILFLHRPESHEDKAVHPKDLASFYAMQEGGSNYIAVSVAKQRNGSTGITQVMFDPGVMRYNEIMRE